MFKKSVKILIFTGLALVIVYFLLSEITAGDILNNLKQLDFKFTALAFVLYFAVNLVRAYRFDLILGKSIGRLRFLYIVFIQNFFNIILPFRLGELSYIHLVSKNSDISLGRNITSLIGVRLFDLFAAVTVFVISILWLSNGFIDSMAFFWVGAGLILIIFLVFISLVFCGAKIINFFQKYQLSRRIFEKFKEAIEGFSMFREKGLFVKISILSFVIWGMISVGGFFLFKSLNINLNFWQIVFVYALPGILSLTPIFVFGGIGSYEGSIAGGLMLLGISKEMAISDGFILHAQDLAFVLILALVGYIGLKFYRNDT